MRIETSLDQITNESNLWLDAIKMEDGGDFFEAFSLYLKNTKESLKQNFLVKAALCSCCAANCLSITGNLAAARQLYLQTAMLYEINGDEILDKSIREALWLYQESYEYYNLSCNSEKAQAVYEKYISLARRVNPFESEEEVMNSLRLRKKNAERIKKEYATLINLYEDKKQKKETIGNNALFLDPFVASLLVQILKLWNDTHDETKDHKKIMTNLCSAVNNSDSVAELAKKVGKEVYEKVIPEFVNRLDNITMEFRIQTNPLFSDIDKTLERLARKEELVKEKSAIPEERSSISSEQPKKVSSQNNAIGKINTCVVLENENNIDITKLDLYDDEMLTSFYEKLYHKIDENSRKRLLAIHGELRRRYDDRIGESRK